MERSVAQLGPTVRFPPYLQVNRHSQSQWEPGDNFQRIVEDLPHLPYDTTRQGTSSSAPQIIYFQVPRLDGDRSPAVDIPDNAVPLSRALENELNTLVDGGRPAPLHDASTKLSIRLLVSSFCELHAIFSLTMTLV